MTRARFRPGRPGRRVGPLALCLPLAATSRAGDPPVPPPVEARISVSDRAGESPAASVSRLGRDWIEATGARTVGELLALIPGVHLVGGDAAAGTQSAQIRGGDPNFTLVLLDGVPLNNPTEVEGGAVDLGSLSTSDLERIEIVRGPLSYYFGSSALGGAIQLFTRRGETATPRIALAADLGSAELGRFLASVGQRRGPDEYHLGAAIEREDGRVGRDRHRQASLQGCFGRTLAGGARLDLAGRWAGADDADYPEGSGGVGYGSGELRRTRDRGLTLGAELGWQASTWRHGAQASLLLDRRERESPAIAPLVPASEESTRLDRVRLGWSASRAFRTSLALTLGVGVDSELGSSDSSFDLPAEAGGRTAGGYRQLRHAPGGFAELTWARRAWTVESGLRVDAPTGQAAAWSPRVGLSYGPRGGSTRLRASLGRAFKLPSLFVLLSPESLGGNRDLRPETSWAADLAVEQHLGSQGLSLTATAFAARYHDLIDFDFASFRHLNRAQVAADGLETELSWVARPGLEARMSLTWQRVRDVAAGEALREQPSLLGGLGLRWRPQRALGLELDARGVSDYRDQQLPVPGRSRVAGRIVLGAAGQIELPGGLGLGLRIDNLADAVYESRIGFPGPSRSLRFNLGYAPRRPPG